MHRLIIIILSITLLVGCKIRIKVPEGARVVSESGAYVCLAGKTCIIEVVDIHFNEVFFVELEAGYAFKKWKKRTRALCANRTGSCPLSTAAFAGQAALLAILESDTVYHLQPVVRKTNESGATTDRNASACFNPNFWAPGSRFVAEYETDHGVRETHDQVIEGSAMFEGRSVRLAEDTITTDIPDSESMEEIYFTLNVAKKRHTTHGLVSRSIKPESSTLRQANNPGALMRFDLTPGQSYTQTFMATVTFEEDDAAFPGASGPSVSEVKRTTTYIGIETITIPAGEREACRFETTTVTSSAFLTFEDNEITWYGVDSGVILKNISGESDNALVEGTLNGKSI